MAGLVFAMNVSLDGYVDHDRFAPAPDLFQHWIDQVRRAAGCLYGRRLYEIMRYWDEDRPDWTTAEREFASVWRSRPKWVASHTPLSLGANATRIGGDLGAEVRQLKASQTGEIDVGGPVLARSLADLGLIDEYRLYLHPVVLGSGAPFFSGPRPPLRFVASDQITADVIRLTYAPA